MKILPAWHFRDKADITKSVEHAVDLRNAADSIEYEARRARILYDTVQAIASQTDGVTHDIAQQGLDKAPSDTLREPPEPVQTELKQSSSENG